MFRTFVVLYSLLISVSLATAETIEKPKFVPGETWTFQITTEQAGKKGQNSGQWVQKHSEVTVVRTGSLNMLVSRKDRGSKMPPVEKMTGSNWSSYRSINGEETVVNQPLNFPLKQGKLWELRFVENHPNDQLKYLENDLNYTVVDWEEVTVPAGKFKALKIEMDGRWKSEMEPSKNNSTSTRKNEDSTTLIIQTKNQKAKVSSGRLYRAYWYAPEAKVYVKAVEESFFSNGTLSRRNTEELESYKVTQ